MFTGTREVDDINFVKGALFFYYFDPEEIKNIYVGDCKRGVDKAVREFSRGLGIEPKIFEVDWNIGKVAGLIRNEEMLKEAEKEFGVFNCSVIGLPCDESKGTIHCLTLARKIGFRTYCYTYDFHNKFVARWPKLNLTY